MSKKCKFCYLWQGYRVFYTLQPDLPIILWHNQEVQSNTNSTIITNLSPNDTYTICVLAYSAKGEGPVSQLITVITNEGSKCHVTLLWLNDWLILKCSTFSRKHALSDSITDGDVLIDIKKKKENGMFERIIPMHGNKTHNDHGESMHLPCCKIM